MLNATAALQRRQRGIAMGKGSTMFKQRVYDVLEVARPGDRLSRLVDIALIGLIAANVLALILESVDTIQRAAAVFFRVFEAVSVGLFSVEYLLRVWSCTACETYRRPIAGRLRYVLSPLALVDLLAILPFYLPMISLDLRSLRAVRLFRLLRMVKLARYSEALRLIGRVLVSRRAELLTTLFILLMLVLLASSLMYFAERDAQPEAFASIPAAMWWAVATLSTVGYGDVYPITVAGKLLASVIAFLGIGLFALPTGILGAAFVEEMQRRKSVPRCCPHCGRELTDP